MKDLAATYSRGIYKTTTIGNAAFDGASTDRPLHVAGLTHAARAITLLGSHPVTMARSSTILSLLLFLCSSLTAQVALQTWVNWYNHGVETTDQSLAVAVDETGCAAVVGYTDEHRTGKDILTARYSATGTLLWAQKYNGPGNHLDVARAVAVDGNLNVIVAGYSYAGETTNSSDFVVIKYSPDGVSLWTNRYDGPANDSDSPVALAVDANGTVFVTGYSEGAATSEDFATIAFSSNGVPLWTNRFEAPYRDVPKAINTHSSGVVVVSGSSLGDFTTIAYSVSGVPLWTNCFSTTANSSEDVRGMHMDHAGNVFVTGWSDDPGPFYDAITIAYSLDGQTIWTNRYNGTLDQHDTGEVVVADQSGNVFVAGISQATHGSSESEDWVTLAYDNSGSPLWTNRFHLSAQDYPRSIEISSNDLVVVTGRNYSDYDGAYFYSMVAYSTSGGPMWTNNLGSPGQSKQISTAVDGSGNVYVTGQADNDDVEFKLATYSRDGQLRWTSSYGSTANARDRAVDVVLDDDGTVFVTGASHATSTSDYATIAYSSAGVALWTNRYGGPGNASDFPKAMVFDKGERVIVTGSSSASANNYDILTVAYSHDGQPLWTNRYDGPAASHDDPYAAAIDSAGTVFIAGSSTGLGTTKDWVTVAYASNGVPVWTNRYSGPVGEPDVARDIAVDDRGQVVVTGYAERVMGSTDVATIAYSSSGVPLWTNFYDGPAAWDDYANAVATDSNGNVFVTGTSFNTHYDYVTIAYSSSGQPLWTNHYEGDGDSFDVARDVAVDDAGNVFVTGNSVDKFTSHDYLTIKYSNAGVPLWTRQYTIQGNSWDYAGYIVLGPEGNVYVTGSGFQNPGFAYDMATVAYSNSGTLLWAKRYNGPANGSDVATGLAVSSNRVVVVGESDTDFTDAGVPDFVVINYLTGLPPEITAGPMDQTSLVGSRVGFTVGAEGTLPLAYQWRRNDIDLLDGDSVAGSLSSNLVLSSVLPGDAAIYSVAVTNLFGSTVSTAATLTVIPISLTHDEADPSEGHMTLSWQTVVGRSYQVQFTTNLSQSVWLDLAPPIVADTETMSYTNSLGFMEQAYFRIRMLP